MKSIHSAKRASVLAYRAQVSSNTARRSSGLMFGFGGKFLDIGAGAAVGLVDAEVAGAHSVLTMASPSIELNHSSLNRYGFHSTSVSGSIDERFAHQKVGAH